jgi:nucleoside-diphosphate-sugar epimerase
MTRALVTGGAGFVGRHLCRRLLQEGLDVYCVDSLHRQGSGQPPDSWPLFRPTGHSHFRFFDEDCRSFFKRVTERFTYVFHLAAIVGGRKLIEGDPLSLADNLSIDAAMWRWAARSECGLVMYASSSAVYPNTLQMAETHVRLHEDMVDIDGTLAQPDQVYGWGKLSGEKLMRFYQQQTGLPAFCVRPFSVYGEDQSEDYPFPSITRRALQNVDAGTLSVWGSGHQQRDFIHIDDCVEFMWRCCQEPPPYSAVNLSSGKPTSFFALAAMVAGALNYHPLIRGTPGTPEGVFSRVGDRSLQDQLGLVPRVSLQDGIERSIEFQRYSGPARKATRPTRP